MSVGDAHNNPWGERRLRSGNAAALTPPSGNPSLPAYPRSGEHARMAGGSRPSSGDPNEESRLPMPEDSRTGDDSGPLPMPGDEHETEKGDRVPMPADTVEILTGGGQAEANPESSTSGDSTGVSETGGLTDTGPTSATKGPGGTTNVDTIIGKLVVEQGLATADDVEGLREELLESSVDPSERSLAQAMVARELITGRQLDRLRAQAEAERKGQQIPGYHVIGKVGAGAMAAVFKARQLSLDRVVAIKVLPRKFSSNRQFIERFYAEGRAAAQLNHPNVVQAFDVGQAGEFHYFVMEYVEGRTVHDVIVERKRYDERDALDVIINVADALKHAHQKGLIHRDVKPKNIIITDSDIAKLADLGLARAIDDKEAALAEQGKAYGTPYYISPEQIRGEVNVGPQADIYSLGATLYHMVTGNVPFNGKNPTEVMQKHIKSPVIPPDHVNPKLSAGISEVIEMMMAKSRRQRYKSCEDVLIDLRAVRKGDTPPIAHKEATTMDLVAVAEATASQPAEIARQESGPSVFSHPVVIVLVVAVILLGVATTVLSIIAFG